MAKAQEGSGTRGQMGEIYENVGYITRWWFQRLFIFTPTWGNDAI